MGSWGVRLTWFDCNSNKSLSDQNAYRVLHWNVKEKAQNTVSRKKGFFNKNLKSNNYTAKLYLKFILLQKLFENVYANNKVS